MKFLSFFTRGRAAYVFAVCLSLFLWSGCAGEKAVQLKHSGTQLINPPYPPFSKGEDEVNAHSTLRDRYALILIIDGGRPIELERLVKSGDLPTIKRLFFDKGAVFKNANTIYPTLSMPGHQAIMTGVYPGNHGIPDLTWLDRGNQNTVDYLTITGHRRMNADLLNRNLIYADSNTFNDTPHTLFHALKGAPSFSSYEAFYDGSSAMHPHLLLAPVWESLIEKRAEQMDIDALQNTITHWQTTLDFPKLTVISCYGLDELSHTETPSGDRILAIYRHIDRSLAELEGIAKKRGILDKMTFVLTADHGQHLTENKEIALPERLSMLGIKTKDDAILKNRDATVASRSVSNAQLYFKDKTGDKHHTNDWTQSLNLSDIERLHPHLLKTLIQDSGIDLIVTRVNDATIRVIAKDSNADITLLRYGKDDWIAYTPLDTPDHAKRDPFNYFKLKATWKPGQFYHADDWQQWTKDSAYPDALLALSQLFQGPDAGDALFIANNAYSFRSFKPSNHGSLDRNDMRVPIYFHGPDIQKGVYDTARTVDIYPTMLAIFGVNEDPLRYDGRRLDTILKPSMRRIQSINPPYPPFSKGDKNSTLSKGSMKPALSKGDREHDLSEGSLKLGDRHKIGGSKRLASLEAYALAHPEFDRAVDQSRTRREIGERLNGEPANHVLNDLRAIDHTLKTARHRILAWQKELNILSQDKTVITSDAARTKANRYRYLFKTELDRIDARSLRLQKLLPYLREPEKTD